ncbi:hypothetical protein H7F51_11070 [Novosphingobium flavum]|uniref:Uncharacterized protein n=1 Tax=Novosphingobium flavum TaxID=1778672 RepID=A0A7X1KM68_9SPHN|nr:hypothetical protein [Novosphingobium flavum]MBC2666058.1 hypothetical protein [Novosphingobium flavum]
MNAAIANIRQDVEFSLQALREIQRIREHIILRGQNGISGLIYAIMLNGSRSHMDIVNKITHLLGDDLFDEANFELLYHTDPKKSGPWCTFDDPDDCPNLDYVINI